jgi:hypothetical protein
MMVSLMSLWLPILISAVLVFVVSSIIHMVLRYHSTDFVKVPAEDDVMETLRKFNIPPGDYVMPYAGSSQAMGSPEYIEKTEKGPVAFFTVMPSGRPAMGKSLVLWFLYCVVVGLFAAYLASLALPVGTEYRAVFRFVSAAAFIGYALALWQNAIWYKRKGSSVLKNTFDGLIYGLVTGGTFGWLWPS